MVYSKILNSPARNLIHKGSTKTVLQKDILGTFKLDSSQIHEIRKTKRKKKGTSTKEIKNICRWILHLTLLIYIKPEGN